MVQFKKIRLILKSVEIHTIIPKDFPSSKNKKPVAWLCLIAAKSSKWFRRLNQIKEHLWNK